MRGHYRILLGMAAGVGKTFRMLQEGRSLHAEGRDVLLLNRCTLDSPSIAQRLVISPHTDAQHKYRAAEWAERNRNAFCDGYAAAAGYDRADHQGELVEQPVRQVPLFGKAGQNTSAGKDFEDQRWQRLGLRARGVLERGWHLPSSSQLSPSIYHICGCGRRFQR